MIILGVVLLVIGSSPKSHHLTCIIAIGRRRPSGPSTGSREMKLADGVTILRSIAASNNLSEWSPGSRPVGPAPDETERWLGIKDFVCDGLTGMGWYVPGDSLTTVCRRCTSSGHRTGRTAANIMAGHRHRILGTKRSTGTQRVNQLIGLGGRQTPNTAAGMLSISPESRVKVGRVEGGNESGPKRYESPARAHSPSTGSRWPARTSGSPKSPTINRH